MSSGNENEDKGRMERVADGAVTILKVVFWAFVAIGATVFTKTGTESAKSAVRTFDFAIQRLMDILFGAGKITVSVSQAIWVWLKNEGKPLLMNCLWSIVAIGVVTVVTWSAFVTWAMFLWHEGNNNAASIIIIGLGLAIFLPNHLFQAIIRTLRAGIGKAVEDVPQALHNELGKGGKKSKNRRMNLDDATVITRPISITAAIHFFMASMLQVFPESMMTVGVVVTIIAMLMVVVSNSQSMGRQRQWLLSIMVWASIVLTVTTIAYDYVPDGVRKGVDRGVAGLVGFTTPGLKVAMITEEVYFLRDSDFDKLAINLSHKPADTLEEGDLVTRTGETRYIDGQPQQFARVTVDVKGLPSKSGWVIVDVLKDEDEPEPSAGKIAVAKDPTKPIETAQESLKNSWSGEVGDEWVLTGLLLKGDLSTRIFDQAVWTSELDPFSRIDINERMEFAFAIPEVGPEYSVGNQRSRPRANGSKNNAYGLSHAINDNPNTAEMFVRVISGDPVVLHLQVRRNRYIRKG